MSDTTIPLPIQVRDLPAMRAACLHYHGPAAGLSAPFEELQRFVATASIGPAGPLMASFRTLVDNADLPGDEEPGPVEAQLFVPVTRLVDDAPGDIEMRRLDSMRAACLVFSGPMDSRFRQHHWELFAWMDAQALPRGGSAHQHAYLSKDSASGHWTVEIRVPILASSLTAAGV